MELPVFTTTRLPATGKTVLVVIEKLMMHPNIGGHVHNTMQGLYRKPDGSFEVREADDGRLTAGSATELRGFFEFYFEMFGDVFMRMDAVTEHDVRLRMMADEL